MGSSRKDIRLRNFPSVAKMLPNVQAELLKLKPLERIWVGRVKPLLTGGFPCRWIYSVYSVVPMKQHISAWDRMGPLSLMPGNLELENALPLASKRGSMVFFDYEGQEWTERDVESVQLWWDRDNVLNFESPGIETPISPNWGGPDMRARATGLFFNPRSLDNGGTYSPRSILLFILDLPPTFSGMEHDEAVEWVSLEATAIFNGFPGHDYVLREIPPERRLRLVILLSGSMSYRNTVMIDQRSGA